MRPRHRIEYAHPTVDVFTLTRQVYTTLDGLQRARTPHPAPSLLQAQLLFSSFTSVSGSTLGPEAPAKQSCVVEPTCNYRPQQPATTWKLVTEVDENAAEKRERAREKERKKERERRRNKARLLCSNSTLSGVATGQGHDRDQTTPTTTTPPCREGISSPKLVENPAAELGPDHAVWAVWLLASGSLPPAMSLCTVTPVHYA